MKIKPDHLKRLREAISAVDTPARRAKYLAGDFPRSDAVKDIDRRYRWDALYDALPAAWVCDYLYPYMNDTHIDTALRAIVPPLR